MLILKDFFVKRKALSPLGGKPGAKKPVNLYRFRLKFLEKWIMDFCTVKRKRRGEQKITCFSRAPVYGMKIPYRCFFVPCGQKARHCPPAASSGRSHENGSGRRSRPKRGGSGESAKREKKRRYPCKISLAAARVRGPPTEKAARMSTASARPDFTGYAPSSQLAQF